MSDDLLKDAQETNLYIELGKTLNNYLQKTHLSPMRILRVLSNMILQVLNNVEKERDV